MVRYIIAQQLVAAPDNCSCCCDRALAEIELARIQCKAACNAKAPQAHNNDAWAVLLSGS